MGGIFGSFQPSSFDFQSASDALAAAEALIDQVFIGITDDDPETTLGITSETQSFTHIPYAVTNPADITHPSSINARARNHEQEFLDSTLTNLHIQESFDSSNLIDGGDDNWARFTSVPEPSSAWLLGCLMGPYLFGLARRQRVK